MIRLEYELILSAALFTVGLYGLLTQKNGIVVLMCIEIILNAAIMNFVAFSAYYNAANGQTFALLAIALSAAEAAVGLAIFLNLYKTHRAVTVDVASMLRW